jgi:hypothetical protein
MVKPKTAAMASIIKYRKELFIHSSKPELWAKTRPICEPNWPTACVA